MKITSLILCSFVIIATGLPLINTGEWWIRVFDFPRIQIAVLTLLAIILTFFFVDFDLKFKLPLLFILLACFLFHGLNVIIYTPLTPVNAKESNKSTEGTRFSLLVTNVLMENEEKDKFHALVERVNPDIILINEPDDMWAESISKLDVEYPHAIKYPLDNTYGMMLLSKLPLSEGAVNFLVKDDIPSIFAKITLHSGDIIDFYGVHPEPPKPGTDTYERDTELLIIGKKIKETQRPTVVAGDLNDVGWSGTSELFRKYSELVDPREGRGLFNTFNAFLPLLRYPLDHVFYSKDFGLILIEKLEAIGSDHFPLLISLNYEPDNDNTADQEKTDAEEEEEVNEKIEDADK